MKTLVTFYKWGPWGVPRAITTRYMVNVPRLKEHVCFGPLEKYQVNDIRYDLGSAPEGNIVHIILS